MKAKIFLSYSRDAEALEAALPRGHSVATVAVLLEKRGYEVFWDKGRPLTDDFRRELETWVEESDVFVFFVSPEAVAPGAFTLTELAWAVKYRRCIGAVMQRDTPLTSLPAALKIPHVFVAKGDWTTEVCEHIERLVRTCRWKRCVSPIGIAGVLALAFVSYFGCLSAFESGGIKAYGVLKVGFAALSFVAALVTRFAWCRLRRARLRLRGKASSSSG